MIDRRIRGISKELVRLRRQQEIHKVVRAMLLEFEEVQLGPELDLDD